MKTSLIALVLSALLSPLAYSENALEIASKFEKQKIEAIESYLEANPEAKDKDVALKILIDANSNLGNFDPVPDLLTRRYALQSKGADANLQLIANDIAKPLVEASVVSGQRDKAKAFITKVKADLAQHPQGAQFSGFLDQLGSDLYLPGIGDTMEFAFTDLNGKEVDLAKMQDKVILVDFWATWCGPCIAEMPNVIAAHQKFGEKGFEVVGISLDDNLDTLKKFTEENSMPWAQYFDGKGWENEIAQRYGIRSIPATFLIGKGGKIVASNLHGPELEAAISKELGIEE